MANPKNDSAFSRALIQQYLQMPGGKVDIVILPNQRAKIFFLDALQRMSPERLQSVHLYTLSEFVNRLTPHVEICDNPLLLTSLLYASLAQELGGDFSLLSFSAGGNGTRETPSPSPGPTSSVPEDRELGEKSSPRDFSAHFTEKFALLQILLKDLNVLWHNLPEKDTGARIDPLQAMELVAAYYETGHSFQDKQFTQRYLELLKNLIDLDARDFRARARQDRLRFIAGLWRKTAELLTPYCHNSGCDWFQNRFIQRSIEWVKAPLVFEGYLMYVAANKWFGWIDKVNAIWGDGQNRRIIVLMAGLLLDRNPFRILQKIKDNLENVHIFWEPVPHLRELEQYLTADLYSVFPGTSGNHSLSKPIQQLLPTSQHKLADHPHASNAEDSPKEKPALFVHTVPTRTAQIGLIRYLLTNAQTHTQDAEPGSRRTLLLLFKEDLLPLLIHLLPEVNISMGLPLHLTALRPLCTLLIETASLLQDQQEICPVELVHRWWEHPLGKLVLHTESSTESSSLPPTMESITRHASGGGVPFCQVFHEKWLGILRTLAQKCAPSALSQYFAQYLELWRFLVRRLVNHQQDDPALRQSAWIHLQAIHTLIQHLQMIFPVVLDAIFSQPEASQKTPRTANTSNKDREEDGRVVPLEFFTVFTQFLLHQVRAPLKGDRLHLWQALGLLETRALTFDRIIIPDVLNSAIRMHGDGNTFLSPVIRAAMYLPVDSIVALRNYYTLFRLVAHAKEVHLIVPARDEHGRETQASTLIHQLQWYLDTEVQHLDYAAGNLFTEMTTHSPEDQEFAVEQNSENTPSEQSTPSEATPLPYSALLSSMPVWLNLTDHQLPSQENDSSRAQSFTLSVSALMDLLICPYRYLLARYWRLSAPTLPPDLHTLDSRLVGSAVHYALQAIYNPQVQSNDLSRIQETLKDLLNTPDQLDNLVQNALLQAMTSPNSQKEEKEHSGGAATPVLRQSVNFFSAREIVRRILAHDLQRLHNPESKPKVTQILHEIPVGNDWLSARIDRIEIFQRDEQEGDGQVRLCDFKYSVGRGLPTLHGQKAIEVIGALGLRIQQIAQLIEIQMGNATARQLQELIQSLQQTPFREKQETYILQLLLYGYLFFQSPSMNGQNHLTVANQRFPDLVIYNMKGVWHSTNNQNEEYEYLIWSPEGALPSARQNELQTAHQESNAPDLLQHLERDVLSPLKDRLLNLLRQVIQEVPPDRLSHILVPLPDDRACASCPVADVCLAGRRTYRQRYHQ